MDIRNRNGVRRTAFDALAANPGKPGLVVLLFIVINTVSALLVTTLLLVLNNRISQTGGLGDLGLRSILSTIRTVLPMVQTVLLWCVHLGYQNAALRMARRQAAQPRDLLEGFSCFGPLVRSILLRGGIYLMLAFFASYIASTIFLMLPMSADFKALTTPLLTDPYAFADSVYADENLFLQIWETLLPMIPMFLAIFLLVAAPFFYQYRMTNYCILDNPRQGALNAMAESIQMMRHNRVSLLKLDLGFWWFYLGQAVAAVALYADWILALAGVTLPLSPVAAHYVCYILSLSLEGILFYFFLNRVETTYATVYEILRPKPQHSGGAVLGNIFDLARDYHE